MPSLQQYLSPFDAADPTVGVLAHYGGPAQAFLFVNSFPYGENQGKPLEALSWVFLVPKVKLDDVEAAP